MRFFKLLPAISFILFAISGTKSLPPPSDNARCSKTELEPQVVMIEEHLHKLFRRKGKTFQYCSRLMDRWGRWRIFIKQLLRNLRVWRKLGIQWKLGISWQFRSRFQLRLRL